MRRLFLLLPAWLLVCSLAGFAQTPSGAVSGIVVDTSGGAIPGAAVLLTSGGREERTVTDSTGRFVFDQVPPGAATVTVLLHGFAPVTMTVSAGRPELRVVLQPAPVSEDVVVHGTGTRGEDRVSRDLVDRYVPADRRPVDILLARPLRTDGLRATECTGCLGAPPRIWVVRSGERTDPLGGLDDAKREALRTYRVQQVWQLTGLTLALLVPA